MTRTAKTERAEVLSEEELREKLGSMIGWRNGVKVTASSLAEQWEVSETLLSLVLSGRRSVGHKIAKALGYERVVTFRRRELENSNG